MFFLVKLKLMSRYAKDQYEKIINAPEASRGLDYFCLECASIVRLRMGEERRAHFYHSDPSPSCRQAGKSLEHLMVQLHIQNLFQEQDRKIVLEKRFASIDRIADAALLDEKIIFEVQCSPMTAEEAIARLNDYHSIGYEVVWILHTKTFLQSKAAALERCLVDKTHYFTDINENGQGSIFDLLAPINKGYRHKKSAKFSIDISASQKNCRKNSFRKQWPLYFSGDIMSQIYQKNLDLQLYQQIFTEEKEAPSLSFFQKAKKHTRLFFDELLGII